MKPANERLKPGPRSQRPPLTPAIQENLVSWTLEGFSWASWSRGCGVKAHVIYKWMEENQKFREQMFEARKKRRMELGPMHTTNDRNNPIGQDHHKAKNTDREVEMARVLHEGGMGYGRIAKLMECSKATVRDWVKGRRRNHEIVKWKAAK